MNRQGESARSVEVLPLEELGSNDVSGRSFAGRLNRSWRFAAALFAIGVVALGAAAAGRFAAGRDGGVTFSQQVVHFGVVQQGRSAARPLRIWNASKSAVRLEQVIASCSCIRTEEIAGTVLSPDESAEFDVEFHVGAVGGEKRQSLTVFYSSGSELQAAECELVASVETPIEPTPRMLDFGEIKAAEPVSERIHFRSADGEAVAFGDVHATDPRFQVAVANAPGEIDVQFHAPGASAQQTINAFAVIELLQPTALRFRVPLRANVAPPFRCSPSVLLLSMGNDRRRKLDFTITAVGASLELVSVRAPDIITCEAYVTSEPRYAVHGRVAISELCPPGPSAGSLEVTFKVDGNLMTATLPVVTTPY